MIAVSGTVIDGWIAFIALGSFGLIVSAVRGQRKAVRLRREARRGG